MVYVSLTWSSTDTLFIKSPISLTQYFSFFMFALRCALALIANVASLSIIYGSLLSCTSTIILLSMNVGCVAVLVSLLVVTIVVLAVIVLINGVVFRLCFIVFVTLSILPVYVFYRCCCGCSCCFTFCCIRSGCGNRYYCCC